MSKAIALIAISAIAAMLTSEVPKQPLIVWNASSSVPIGFYAIERRAPHRDELALVNLPPKFAAWAAERGYLPQAANLIKPVVATRGDRVCRMGRAVAVRNGIAATAVSRDGADRLMFQWRGCRALGFGELFVLSSALNSFDSRYFGPVPGRHVLGTASAIWTY